MSEDRLTEEEARDLGPSYMTSTVRAMKDEIKRLVEKITQLQVAAAVQDDEVVLLRAECAAYREAMREAMRLIANGQEFEAENELHIALGGEVAREEA